MKVSKIQTIRFIVQISFFLSSLGVFLLPIPNRGLTFILISLVFGSFFCGWFCPLGFIQEFFGKIGTIFLKKKYKLPEKYQNYFINTRYVLLAVLTIQIISDLYNLTGLSFGHSFYGILNGRSIGIVAIVIMFFYSLISIFVDRPYCNYLCTNGAKLGLASYFRIFSIKRDKNLCLNCKKCSTVCPMNIKVNEVEYVKNPHCICCFKCISNCSQKDVLKYKFIFSKK